MGTAQVLPSVLRATQLVAARNPRVQFVFVGGGVALEGLKADAAALGLPNARFLPVRPAAQVGSLLAAADALLVHLRDDPLFSITIPSKTQAYLAARRPIVMAMRGDASDLTLARRANAGVCVAPEDPKAWLSPWAGWPKWYPRNSKSWAAGARLSTGNTCRWPREPRGSRNSCCAPRKGSRDLQRKRPSRPETPRPAERPSSGGLDPRWEHGSEFHWLGVPGPGVRPSPHPWSGLRPGVRLQDEPRGSRAAITTT